MFTIFEKKILNQTFKLTASARLICPLGRGGAGG